MICLDSLDFCWNRRFLCRPCLIFSFLLSSFFLFFLLAGVIHASPVYDSGGIYLSLPPGQSVIVSNITVSNVESPNITAIQLQTFISGTFNGSFSFTLVAHKQCSSLKVVPTSSIFNGTIWSDQTVGFIFANGRRQPTIFFTQPAKLILHDVI